MKKLATFALVSLAIFALAMPAVAQPEVGDIGVFFDVAGTQGSATIAGFVVTPMYIMGYGLGDLSGWESSVNFSDLTWNVLSATLNPAGALNVGSVGNFIVGLGLCANGGAGFYTLVTYSIGYFVSPIAPNDVTVCLGPSAPSSFGAANGYSSCADELIPFGLANNGSGVYPNGCGVINPVTCPTCPVSTTDASWGGVKAKF